MAKYNLDEEIKPGQSMELLKELHILTRDGKLNQDSRRKAKQVNHLVQFIEPLLAESSGAPTLVDHGAGKSYLGFILYDLLFSKIPGSKIFGIEHRAELVASSKALAQKLKFDGMHFLSMSVADSEQSIIIPDTVDIVTALHACDTATDDAISFALKKKAKHLVLVPCCQAELAAIFRKNKGREIKKNYLTEIYRHPIHTREFASLLTNALRCLRLEAHGYQVTVTELVGWEHSMKNELIVATQKNLPGAKAQTRIAQIMNEFGISELNNRFS